LTYILIIFKIINDITELTKTDLGGTLMDLLEIKLAEEIKKIGIKNIDTTKTLENIKKNLKSINKKI
jgi:hypothetical protein